MLPLATGCRGVQPQGGKRPNTATGLQPLRSVKVAACRPRRAGPDSATTSKSKPSAPEPALARRSSSGPASFAGTSIFGTMVLAAYAAMVAAGAWRPPSRPRDATRSSPRAWRPPPGKDKRYSRGEDARGAGGDHQHKPQRHSLPADSFTRHHHGSPSTNEALARICRAVSHNCSSPRYTGNVSTGRNSPHRTKRRSA